MVTWRFQLDFPQAYAIIMSDVCEQPMCYMVVHAHCSRSACAWCISCEASDKYKTLPELLSWPAYCSAGPVLVIEAPKGSNITGEHSWQQAAPCILSMRQQNESMHVCTRPWVLRLKKWFHTFWLHAS